MDSQGWQLVHQTIRAVARTLPQLPGWYRFSDVLIVAMYLWAVAHDRPQSWACDRHHYYGPFRPRRLPSASQFSRRIRSERCLKILEGVFRRLAGADRIPALCFLDGRPLVVGSCSKDTDARAGRVSGGFARGYRLHALISEDRRVLCWMVTSLNAAEPTVALQLVGSVPVLGLVLGDGNYDSQALYEAVAASKGNLLTPVPPTAGQGHRRQSPARLGAIEAWHGVAGYVYRQRIGIEQCFAHQSAYGGGLGPLPAWVRSLPRVRRWVGAKLCLYNARLAMRRTAA